MKTLERKLKKNQWKKVKEEKKIKNIEGFSSEKGYFTF